MDQLQERLTRIGLEVAAQHGFVLGGGHAVQLLGPSTVMGEVGCCLMGSRVGPQAESPRVLRLAGPC
jgi:hypothetical protein